MTHEFFIKRNFPWIFNKVSDFPYYWTVNIFQYQWGVDDGKNPVSKICSHTLQVRVTSNSKQFTALDCMYVLTGPQHCAKLGSLGRRLLQPYKVRTPRSYSSPCPQLEHG